MKKILTLLAAPAAFLAFSASPANAAVVLTNGSFETTGTRYSTALGGLREATGWTNLTSLSIQASSALADNSSNAEFPAAVSGWETGDRYLRLVTDGTSANNIGRIAQNLGTMTVGETYTITADVFGGPGANVNYEATISLVNQVTATPSTTYNSQTISGLADEAIDTFNFSYTATALDDGNDLVLLLSAPVLGSGSHATRGGIDNIQLTAVPEPATWALLTGLLAFSGVALRRRRA